MKSQITNYKLQAMAKILNVKSMFFLNLVFVCFLMLVMWSLPPKVVLAHEVYVLTHEQYQAGLADTTAHLIRAATTPSNWLCMFAIAVGVIFVLGVSLWFWRSHLGAMTDRFLKRGAPGGLVFMRLMLAAVFFYSALTHAFLGPEISTRGVPWHVALQFFMYLVSVCFLFGVFTELAALVALFIFILMIPSASPFINSYIYYIGELAALLIFGSRILSVDKRLFGLKRWTHKWRDYETLIVRVFFGLGLLYAALYVKVMHAAVTLQVVNEYHLTRFHALFPHDPLLVVLGAAVVESTIAIFLIIGFQVRLTVLVMLFYLTLSLLFFGEVVWPHLVLYGISIYLLCKGAGKWSVDNYVLKRFSKQK